MTIIQAHKKSKEKIKQHIHDHYTYQLHDDDLFYVSKIASTKVKNKRNLLGKS